MQKARGHAARRHRAPTARRHGVSGSVSSPGRGSSHRSVALLGSLSVVARCLALRDGPRRFGPGFTCPSLLGSHSEGPDPSPTGLSPAAARLSRRLRLNQVFLTSFGTSPMNGPTTPRGVPRGLGWSPFARRYWGSRGCFPFLRVLRCFSSPGAKRRSRDRRAFGPSPELFAACHAQLAGDA